MPHGAVMANWTPAAEGALQLSPILSPLEPYKNQVVVLSNLAHAMAVLRALATTAAITRGARLCF